MRPSTEYFYIISLEEIVWGGILMAITMGAHGFGMIMVLRINNFLNRQIGKRKGFGVAILPVMLASCLILLVHLSEVLIWSAFFLWKDAFPNQSVAYYYSLNAYTTLGSNLLLPINLRLLGGMLSAAGLLTFAWSTGILITLAQKFQQRVLPDHSEKATMERLAEHSGKQSEHPGK